MTTPNFCFPGCSAGKESTCNSGDMGLTLGLGRSPGEGKGYPLQYSGLENSMDCIVHGVAKSQTPLSDFHFTSAGFLLKVGRVIRPHLVGDRGGEEPDEDTKVIRFGGWRILAKPP